MRAIKALALGVLLTGCTTTYPLIPPQSECTTCIGPYDMTLTSHREAVLGKRP